MEVILIKADNFGVDWINVNLPFPCEIHFLRPRYDPSEFKHNDSFKVLLINSEPSPWCISENDLHNVADKFDLIIGKKKIYGIDNISIIPFGGSFVEGAPPKEIGLSNLLSIGTHDDALLPGHIFRVAATINLLYKNFNSYEVYKSNNLEAHINKLNPDLHSFILSLKTYPHQYKDYIYKKTHNIAIENFSENNYFTEKLIDCFKTFTIPVYWGCLNIGDYFDTRGMINNLEDINKIIEHITIDDYLERMTFIIKNYESSKNYWYVLDNVKTAILNAF